MDFKLGGPQSPNSLLGPSPSTSSSPSSDNQIQKNEPDFLLRSTLSRFNGQPTSTIPGSVPNHTSIFSGMRGQLRNTQASGQQLAMLQTLTSISAAASSHSKKPSQNSPSTIISQIFTSSPQRRKEDFVDGSITAPSPPCTLMAHHFNRQFCNKSEINDAKISPGSSMLDSSTYKMPLKKQLSQSTLTSPPAAMTITTTSKEATILPQLQTFKSMHNYSKSAIQQASSSNLLRGGAAASVTRSPLIQPLLNSSSCSSSNNNNNISSHRRFDLIRSQTQFSSSLTRIDRQPSTIGSGSATNSNVSSPQESSKRTLLHHSSTHIRPSTSSNAFSFHPSHINDYKSADSPILSQSFYHTSLRHIEMPDEIKNKQTNNNSTAGESIQTANSSKKLIAHLTSNALLPLSFVNQIRKNAKRDPSSSLLYSKDEPAANHSSELCNTFEEQEDPLQQLKTNTEIKIPRISSLKCIRKVYESTTNEEDLSEKSALSTTISNTLLNSSTTAFSSTQDRRKVQFAFQQTHEQKQFEADLLQRIREKKRPAYYSHTLIPLNSQDNDYSKDMSMNFDEEDIPTNKAIVVKKKTFPQRVTSQKNSTPQGSALGSSQQSLSEEWKQVLEQFRAMLVQDMDQPTSQINQGFTFYFSNFMQKSQFISILIYLFETALVAAVKKDASNMSSKKFPPSYKIPEKLFQSIKRLFRTVTAELLVKQPQLQETLRVFESFVDAQYEHLDLKPMDLLEELGGKTRVEAFLNDIHIYLCKALRTSERLPEKRVNEIGLALLTNDGSSVSNSSSSSIADSFFNELKRTKSISDSDLVAIKHGIYTYLFDGDYRSQKIVPFDDDTKMSFIKVFEQVRFKYFLPTVSQTDTDAITKEISKHLKSRKPLTDYFSNESEEREDTEDVSDQTAIETKKNNKTHQNKRVQLFLLQIMDCFFYRIAPSALGQWLVKNTCKSVDAGFFSQFRPLFVEHFKLSKRLSSEFLQILDMKIFWIKMHGNIGAFDGLDILMRIEEVLSHTARWIEAMINSKQLTKQQQAIVAQISDLRYLRFFLKSILNEDTFFPGETTLMLEAFHTSIDAVHFQLKGLKRIFLLMKYKTQAAYEIASFFTNVFTNALQTFNS